MWLTPCSRCGGGPLAAGDDAAGFNGQTGVLTIRAICPACKALTDIRLDACGLGDSMIEQDLSFAEDAIILSCVANNPTDESSHVIDVAGWLTVYGMLVDRAGKAADRADIIEGRAFVRRLQVRAADCLDEALKFFDADNELPPADAFFTEKGLNRFREHPDLFTRDRLIDLKAKLPAATNHAKVAQVDQVDDRQTTAEKTVENKPAWWQFWK